MFRFFRTFFTFRSHRGAERWISKINGEMNIPSAQPLQKARDLTKQAEYQARVAGSVVMGSVEAWDVLVTKKWGERKMPGKIEDKHRE